MKKLIIGMSLLVAAGTLFAQPVPSPRVEVAEDAMSLQVVDYEKKMGVDLRIATEIQQRARKQKDVIKLNCVNDKLLQMKAVRNIFDTTLIIFRSTQGNEQREHFEKLGGNVRDTAKLREEAQACVGEHELPSSGEGSFTGPDIPDDPSQPLFPGSIEPPGYASPFS